MPTEPGESRRLRKRTLAAAVMIVLLIPAVLFLGMYFLEDRKYYIVSLVIICLTMAPFFMVFEGRKPQARELVLIAALVAIAVAGRAAFFMLPQFKPVVAIVIIAAVCLGAETGFLVGAMTGFVSNFFFGQGPWTPWQMFCFGMIGFLAGILARKGLLKKTKLQLCIFGGLSAFFIYGGIIDVWTILMFTRDPQWETAVLLYGTGFWFNLIHATATVFFLFFLANPMIEKIERIKIKYGMLD